jgi:hypothetical protein
VQVFISFASGKVNKILQKTGLRDTALIALAGLGTGALSYAVMMYWPTALQIPFPISLGKYGGTGVSSLPGLLFGALVAFCNWKFGIRDKMHLGVIVAFTLISWVLAVNVTQFTFDYITKYTKSPPAASSQDDTATANAAGNATGGGDAGAPPPPPPPEAESLPFIPGLVGMIGGLIGGVGTLLGVAIVNVRMRRPETLLPIATGAVLLGLILQAAFLSEPYGTIGYLLLFVCWQSMVATMIVRALSMATAESQ